MRLSRLQRYILLECYGRRGPTPIGRHDFERFYASGAKKPSKKDQANILSRSIERLIDQELAIGYGRRTPHKWYIDTIKLTQAGRRLTRSLLGQQQELPFKLKKRT